MFIKIFEINNIFFKNSKLQKHSKVGNLMIEYQKKRMFFMARNYKTSAGNYKSSTGNFKTVGNCKIMSLKMSKMFQAMV